MSCLDDERGARASNFIIRGANIQAPGSIDLPVCAAYGALIAEAQAGCNLLIGQPLGQQSGDDLLVGLSRGRSTRCLPAMVVLETICQIRLCRTR